MSRKRRKKKKGIGMIIFLSLIIVCCLIFIFFIGKGYLTDAVKSKVTQKVAEQVFEKALESAGDPEAAEKAKQIVANMDEADKKAGGRDYYEICGQRNDLRLHGDHAGWR